ncbi:hypothetical protein QJS10_CPB20g00535 [Acorus calamus]|uniref:ACT domain-containing protein ACR n=1 Tax=Acorus calamus TaxID=4465 RepID=A0AAV9CAM3_ACOCL|nr:hypothetical protein QJS10_CPB20g00535 [Acorus calamus]
MEDEYTKLVRRMNPPGVLIDNDACEDATIIRVDSENKHGNILEVVQLLTDQNFIVKKGYMTSDGGWFMNVFYATDREGKKITDTRVIRYLHNSIVTGSCFRPTLMDSLGVRPSKEHTFIELTGTDRPGLLSEVCAVLTDLKCNIVNAEFWTHNTRAAAVVCITDKATGCVIDDPHRLSTIKEIICKVLGVNSDLTSAKMMTSMGVTHTERRLHQMLHADRDYDHVGNSKTPRPQYEVFHGVVHNSGIEAYQEYYIRHVGGRWKMSEAERQCVTQCLEAAIERRDSEGLELELRTKDREGLLLDITRTFRENGVCIRRAEMSIEDGMAVDNFHVTDMLGNAVEAKEVESLCAQICKTSLQVRKNPTALSLKPPKETITSFLQRNCFQSIKSHAWDLLKRLRF